MLKAKRLEQKSSPTLIDWFSPLSTSRGSCAVTTTQTTTMIRTTTTNTMNINSKSNSVSKDLLEERDTTQSFCCKQNDIQVKCRQEQNTECTTLRYRAKYRNSIRLVHVTTYIARRSCDGTWKRASL